MIYRVAIVEPSEIVQTGVKCAVENAKELEVVALLGDAYRIDEKIAANRANVVIINPNVFQFHKRNDIKSVFDENITVIALVTNYLDNNFITAFDGVIDIFEPICKIETTILEAVNKNEKHSDNSANELNELSEREKEILIAMVKGLTNKEIATQFNISIHTVISHRKNITRKTSIKSLSGLTVYALLNNLIKQDQVQ